MIYWFHYSQERRIKNKQTMDTEDKKNSAGEQVHESLAQIKRVGLRGGFGCDKENFQ
jgi:hypothetical protein